MYISGQDNMIEFLNLNNNSRRDGSYLNPLPVCDCTACDCSECSPNSYCRMNSSCRDDIRNQLLREL